ncbi:helix-turn-helix domain-containing protein [Hymenobacter sp. GOD-10R]|uniref:helix-turn-helix domain-containing protein n=1 Tax=Hymenobacter sp. GOD-10R TaxID=3093922 RepID=UPI002D772F9F|nr:helix-turn-helix domain-containing protein [Hymenobacter sp. GOD-10R]WRQ29149.1 helix-turn-helix domain-containing protein [Hymenobacter sp. GOD-10R]
MQSTIITAGITPAELLEQFRAVVRFELQQVGIAMPTNAVETEELLTVKQAAALLNVTVHSIHEWKRIGKLPYSKMGSRTYFKRSELLSSLQSQQRSLKGGRRG